MNTQNSRPVDGLDAIRRATQVVFEEPLVFLVGHLLLTLAIVTSGVTVIGPILLAGPLLFGFLRTTKKRLDGEAVDLPDLLEGFRSFGPSLVLVLMYLVIAIVVALPLALISIVLGFIPCLGTILALIPSAIAGIVVGAALLLSGPIAALEDEPPYDAIVKSVQYARDNPAPMLILAALLSALGALGALVALVGTLVASPIILVTTVIVWQDIRQGPVVTVAPPPPPPPTPEPPPPPAEPT